MCALILFKQTIRSNKLFAIIGFLLIIIPIFLYNESTIFPGLYALPPVAGAMLIILFARNDGVISQLLSLKLVVGVGLVSFSLYLWHQPIFAFSRLLNNNYAGEDTRSVLIALTFVLSYLTWRFVEKPFRDSKILNSRTIWICSASVASILVIFGLLGHFTQGFKHNHGTDRQWDILDNAKYSPMREKCHTDGMNYLKPEIACKYQGSDINLAVLGNSHGVELAWALSEKLKHNDIGLYHLTYAGCGPAYGAFQSEESLEPRMHCPQWTSEAVDFIIHNDKIRTVVISYSTDTFRGRHSDLTKLGQQRQASYIRVIQQLHAAGKKVIVVLQAPRLPRDIQIVVLSSPESDFVKGTRRDEWITGSEGIYHAISELPKDILIIDPINSFCDAQWCYAVKDGNAMYYDTGHMSVEGAKELAQSFIDLITD
jgi:hypothetical protein